MIISLHPAIYPSIHFVRIRVEIEKKENCITLSDPTYQFNRGKRMIPNDVEDSVRETINCDRRANAPPLSTDSPTD